MQISMIGAGGIASGLASLFTRHGHIVTIGSRDPLHVRRELRELVGGRVTTYREAASANDFICLCIPWEHNAEALEALGNLDHKLLLDPSNPETPDGRSLALGHSTSGAEIIASRAPGAKVVKAFNYVYAELLSDPEALARVQPSIFLCGDDVGARRAVTDLVLSCGLEPIDSGDLANARYLEPLALLMVQLVRRQGWGPTQVGMKLSHR